MGLPSEVNWLVSFPKQSWSSSEVICWPISQPNSLEYHPVKFLSQPYPFLQKHLVMHSHLILGYPVHMKMHYAIFKIITQYVNMHIFNQLQLHACNSTHQSSPNLAHLRNLHYHLQWPIHTIIFHIIVTSC